MPAPDPLLEAAILDALARVEEPRLRRGIVELGMVEGVVFDRAGAKKGASAIVAIAEPLPDGPHWNELRLRVMRELASIDGLEGVDVAIQEMAEDAKVAVARVLKGESPPDPLAVTDASAAPAARVRVNPFTDTRTRVLAIASGKGGVGKSSVTANLAIALAGRERSVAVVDADVWGFSLPRMLGIAEPPGIVDDVLIPPEAYGVRLISMGFFSGEEQAVVWRGPMLHKALEQFLTDVHWSEPDYLLVDMPPGTGDVSLSIAQFLPRAEVVVVTTPQAAAQKVAQRAAAMAEKVDLDVIGVVENMSWFRGDDGKAYAILGAGGGGELAERLGVPLLGQLPLVPQLREGGDEGRPIVIADPDNEASRIFREIAEHVDTAIRPRRISHPELKIG